MKTGLSNKRTVRILRVIAILVPVFNTTVVCAASPEAHVRAGWVEKAVIYPDGAMLHAKLDTGAKTSSINAQSPEYYDRNGQRWVRLKLSNRDGDRLEISAPIIREVKIKRHFGVSQVRPVISLEICIGNVRKQEEVNLVDRQGLNYQLLIGRNFLKGSLLIDSGATYLLPPSCPD